MRTAIKETQVFSFDELSEEAKETAIDNLRDINVDYEWWEYIYADAEEAGIKITSFDFDRRHEITGHFTNGGEFTANAIIENHGEKCETYKTAKKYLEKLNDLVIQFSDGENLNRVTEENEYDFDNACEELEKEFLHDILEDYLVMLRHEYEYQTSDEAIIETIKANEYEFDSDGNLYY